MHVRKATLEDIPTIHRIAHEVWPTAYDGVITPEQITFMLDWMYSPSSLEKQMMDDGCLFFIAVNDSESLGFASVSKTSTAQFKLHKLYVLSTKQGLGIGKMLLQTVMDEVRQQGGGLLQLQVNKKNKARHFYFANGFEVLQEAVFDIGHGFVMDDYIMGITV